MQPYFLPEKLCLSKLTIAIRALTKLHLVQEDFSFLGIG